jgi:hypothetical protein
MTIAKSYAQTVAGEAVSGTDAQRDEDQRAIISSVVNRSKQMGVSVEDVWSDASQINAYGKTMPAGTDTPASLARVQANIDYVAKHGVTHQGIMYATPAAIAAGKATKVKGSVDVLTTAGHVFSTIPAGTYMKHKTGVTRTIGQTARSTPIAAGGKQIASANPIAAGKLGVPVEALTNVTGKQTKTASLTPTANATKAGGFRVATQAEYQTHYPGKTSESRHHYTAPQAGVEGKIAGIVSDTLGKGYGFAGFSGGRYGTGDKGNHNKGQTIDGFITAPDGSIVTGKADRMAVGLAMAARGMRVGMDPAGKGYMGPGIHAQLDGVAKAWGNKGTIANMTKADAAQFTAAYAAAAKGEDYTQSRGYVDYVSAMDARHSTVRGKNPEGYEAIEPGAMVENKGIPTSRDSLTAPVGVPTRPDSLIAGLGPSKQSVRADIDPATSPTQVASAALGQAAPFSADDVYSTPKTATKDLSPTGRHTIAESPAGKTLGEYTKSIQTAYAGLTARGATQIAIAPPSATDFPKAAAEFDKITKGMNFTKMAATPITAGRPTMGQIAKMGWDLGFDKQQKAFAQKATVYSSAGPLSAKDKATIQKAGYSTTRESLEDASKGVPSKAETMPDGGWADYGDPAGKYDQTPDKTTPPSEPMIDPSRFDQGTPRSPADQDQVNKSKTGYIEGITEPAAAPVNVDASRFDKGSPIAAGDTKSLDPSRFDQGTYLNDFVGPDPTPQSVMEDRLNKAGGVPISAAAVEAATIAGSSSFAPAPQAEQVSIDNDRFGTEQRGPSSSQNVNGNLTNFSPHANDFSGRDPTPESEMAGRLSMAAAEASKGNPIAVGSRYSQKAEPTPQSYNAERFSPDQRDLSWTNGVWGGVDGIGFASTPEAPAQWGDPAKQAPAPAFTGNVEKGNVQQGNISAGNIGGVPSWGSDYDAEPPTTQGAGKTTSITQPEAARQVASPSYQNDFAGKEPTPSSYNASRFSGPQPDDDDKAPSPWSNEIGKAPHMPVGASIPTPQIGKDPSLLSGIIQAPASFITLPGIETIPEEHRLPQRQYQPQRQQPDPVTGKSFSPATTGARGYESTFQDGRAISSSYSGIARGTPVNGGYATGGVSSYGMSENFSGREATYNSETGVTTVSDDNMSFIDNSGAHGDGGTIGGWGEGDSDGGEKVLCTHYNKIGWISDATYAADEIYGMTVPMDVKAGYWAIAKPLVRLLPDHRLLELAVFPPVWIWSKSMEHQDAWWSKVVRYVGEGICAMVSRLPQGERNGFES